MINNLIECHKSELCLRQISKCDKKQQQQDCRTQNVLKNTSEILE